MLDRVTIECVRRCLALALAIAVRVCLDQLGIRSSFAELGKRLDAFDFVAECKQCSQSGLATGLVLPERVTSQLGPHPSSTCLGLFAEHRSDVVGDVLCAYISEDAFGGALGRCLLCCCRDGNNELRIHG